MEADELRLGETVLEAPWRSHGHDMSRVLALSDGIFAFAMTLLVLDLVIPTYDHGGALLPYLESSAFLTAFYSYVITFFIIYLWWSRHHQIFQYIHAFDGTLLRWNVLFLIFVAMLPFATLVLNAAGSAPIGIVFFAASQMAACGCLIALWQHASGRGRLIPAELPKSWVEHVTFGAVAAFAIFGLSLAVGIFSPTFGEFCWLGLFFLPALRRHARGPRQLRVEPSRTPG